MIMKKICLLMGIAAFFACNESNTQKEKKEEVKEGMQKVGEDIKAAANSTGDYLTEQKKQAADAISERIKEIDQTTAELKKEGSEKSDAARKKLESLKVEMNKKMKDIKNSSAETWDSTRGAADQLMKKSDKEWTNFKQDFKDLFKKDSGNSAE
jgi:ElaB/YqjD/DUF883 family membrane-anchored ribosome-binding protein